MNLSPSARKHVRRFVKFCIVGASSTLIQLATLQVILRLFPGRSDAVVLWGNAAGVVLAILNGFYWNRRWTFQRHGSPGAGRQFARFIAVSAVGLALNTAFMYLFYVRLRLFRHLPHAPLLNQLLTIALVVFWNFTANTKWSFAGDETPPAI